MDKYGRGLAEETGDGIEAGIELNEARYDYGAHLLFKIQGLPRAVLEEKYLALVMQSAVNLENALDD